MGVYFEILGPPVNGNLHMPKRNFKDLGRARVSSPMAYEGSDSF